MAEDPDLRCPMISKVSALRALLQGIFSNVLVGTFLLAMARIRIRRLRRRGEAVLDALVMAPHDRWLWRGAGLLALTLHGGGIAVAVRVAIPDKVTNLGAAALEVQLELTALGREAADLPPTLEADNAVAVEKAINNPIKWLNAVPIETNNPDLNVSRDTTHTAQEDETRAKVNEETPSREDVASEAASAPALDAKEARHLAAPALGPGESAQRIQLTWEMQLLAHLARHKRYPTEVARPIGQVTLTFVLDRAGHVVSATVLKGSGDEAMDQAALAMMYRSDPVPPPPPLVADVGLSFTIPVLFRARQPKR